MVRPPGPPPRQLVLQRPPRPPRQQRPQGGPNPQGQGGQQNPVRTGNRGKPPQQQPTRGAGWRQQGSQGSQGSQGQRQRPPAQGGQQAGWRHASTTGSRPQTNTHQRQQQLPQRGGQLVPFQGQRNGQESVGLVDSGVGGAMAGGRVRMPIAEFGSVASLPIGDKAPTQIETYTAQMVAQGMINGKMDHVIIACNTASTAKENAVKHVKEFIRRQTANPEASVLTPENLQRAQELQRRIDADPQYLEKHIHGIIQPTASEAADKADSAFFDNGKRIFSAVIDSTVGTAKSGAYPTAVLDALDAKMEARGYTRQAAGPNDSITSADGSITKSMYTYRNAKGQEKIFALQSRGNPDWVPAIEAGTLNQPATVGGGTQADQLVRESRANSNALQFEGPRAKDNDFKNRVFDRAPDLNMLCCTHYPAMREALRDNYGSGTDFLSQDGVVANMVENLSGRVGVTPDAPISVTLGSASMTDQDRADKEQVVTNVVGPQKPVTVDQHTPEEQGEYEAIHKDVEHNRPADNRQQSPDGEVLHEESDGVHTAWTQDKQNPNPANRANSQLVGGVKINPESAAGAVRKSTDYLTEQGVPPEEIRRLHSNISQVGRLMTTGEKRGVDILSTRQEPGAQLFNAATDMAQLFKSNQGKQGAERQGMAIMTGFTVVDNQGNKVAGENDGPPGAVVLAKQALDHNTPATLVMDTGSEASVFAAAKAAGLVLQDNNPPGTPPAERTFAGSVLARGLSVEVVDHGPGSNTENPHTVAQVQQNLENRNTALVVSIERPGPNANGQLSNMRGQDISRFNADLSPLVSGPWKTIGIGDGGNEIGTGGARQDTQTLRKPDHTQVVNNGNNIAAEATTDRMILASVSNNGGVALAAASGELAKALGLEPPATPDSPPRGPRPLVDLYKRIVGTMHSEGISIDGVNKNNAQTVDGRTLHRPEGAEPVAPGTEGATHDDMFDRMVALFSGQQLPGSPTT